MSDFLGDFLGDFLIVRLAAAGDVLLTTALAHALRRARPQSQIAWLTSRYAAPLLAGNPDVDTVLAAPTPGPGLAAQARALAALASTGSALSLYSWRRRHPQATVLLAHRSLKLRALLRLAGFRRIVAWGREAPFELEQHRLAQLGALLQAAGVAAGGDSGAAADLRPQLHLEAAERADGAAAWGAAPAGAPRWVLAPGGAGNPWARMPNRRWAPERFGTLARRARAEGIVVRWVGGPGDRDVIARSAPDLPAAAIDAATRSSLRERAAVIAAADVVIGNDSLPLIMAQALGRPGLGLYGPTAGAFIHAPGQAFVQGEAGCGPCYDPRRGVRGQAYTCGRARCMEQISAAAVWQLALKVHHG